MGSTAAWRSPWPPPSPSGLPRLHGGAQRPPAPGHGGRGAHHCGVGGGTDRTGGRRRDCIDRGPCSGDRRRPHQGRRRPLLLPGAVVYSEEDLRAGVPDVDMRLAVARASGSFPSTSPPARSPAVCSPRISFDVASGRICGGVGPGGVAVEAMGGGRYDVTVVFRTVAGNGERPVAVTPVRAVRVPVVVDRAGASGVADLPSPGAGARRRRHRPGAALGW